MLTSNAAITASATCVNDQPPALPILCSKARARAEWGDVGNTSFYAICRAHNVTLVRIGARTAVAGEDVARVATALIAASKPPPIDAKALAKRSVAARQARRTSQSIRRGRGTHEP